MKHQFLIIIFLFTCVFTSAQKRNNIWCFGDSAGIDFNFSTPQIFTSFSKTRGSCTSIADSSGNLVIYTNYTPWGTNTRRVRVFNNQNQIIQNGDSIVGVGWYRENILVPYPDQSNIYYLFSVGVTNDYGLYYSLIDMNLNGGLGAVTQKNIQILAYEMDDGIQAIKHGNGRDWWLLCHRADISTNEFFKFLITPWGISSAFIQAIGDSSYPGGLLNINFSSSGNKVAIVNYNNLFEIYNFDRCTGDFSVIPSFNFPTTSWEYFNFWNCEFSPMEEFLYLSYHEQTTYLFQLNLIDSNPWITRDTLWIQDSIMYAGGQLELAPDGKIYYACSWYDGIHFNYPYPDSAYYPENMNLGVINSPDSLGLSCNFLPYSFYLGGNRTYLGLPNNPNYDLPPDSNSLCDTLSVGISALTFSKSELKIFYHSGWQTAFINVRGLTGKNYSLQVYDLTGRIIFKEEGKLSSEYFTIDLPCSNFSTGLYTVFFQTEMEKLVKRFVKN